MADYSGAYEGAYESGGLNSLTKAEIDDSYAAGVAELESQLDRLVERLSNLEDKVSVYAYFDNLELKNVVPSDMVMGKSDRGKRIWDDANRLRQSINRLERITASLDL